MSKSSDAFENEIVCMVAQHIGKNLPYTLPNWLIEEGVIPGSKILGVDGIGSKSKRNKTDVIIHLEHSMPIKISAKLKNADHFGNWYGHTRFLQEFGKPAFDRMTLASTNFANSWSRITDTPFVGVSICFGRRTGNTAQNFTDIFQVEDILTVARGYGEGDHVANCMYIANHSAYDLQSLINSLEEISIENVLKATETFMVAHRPVNPLTEGSNRGKNVYTRFLPYEPLPQKTIISSAKELFLLGKFVSVEPTRLNHNHILYDLEKNYNIIIPKKPK